MTGVDASTYAALAMLAGFGGGLIGYFLRRALERAEARKATRSWLESTDAHQAHAHVLVSNDWWSAKPVDWQRSPWLGQGS